MQVIFRHIYKSIYDSATIIENQVALQEDITSYLIWFGIFAILVLIISRRFAHHLNFGTIFWLSSICCHYDGKRPFIQAHHHSLEVVLQFPQPSNHINGIGLARRFLNVRVLDLSSAQSKIQHYAYMTYV